MNATDAAEGDFFGRSVSVSTDTAVVGAPVDDDAGPGSGSAYVFARAAGMWTQQQKLTASDAAAGDLFGYSVSVSGDTAVIGAQFHDDVGSDSGSAYVFVRSVGVWTQQTKLTASDAAPGDEFGRWVSVSGETAIVGAYLHDAAGSDSGSAYVFVRSGAGWTQQQKLIASDAEAEDYFGFSVSVSGDTAVVGAYFDDDAGTGSGSAYVFSRSGGVWMQQQKLTALDAAAGDHFGWSVSVNGDTAVVGAYGKDGAGTDSGSAYIFLRSGSTWTQQQKLTASDAAVADAFGFSVSIDGDTAAIGALFDDDAGTDSGSAYVFARTGSVWTLQQKLTASDAAPDDRFGISVSVSGITAVVGAVFDDDRGTNSGSAYVFQGPPPCSPTVGDDVCIGGTNAGALCAQHSDCSGGLCQLKNRFITAVIPGASTSHGLKVALVDIDANSVATPSDYNGTDRWAGAPSLDVDDGTSPPFNAARLQCAYLSNDWSVVGQLHLYGDVVVPGSTYDVFVCSAEAGPCLGALRVSTAKWGDIRAPLTVVNFQDIVAVVDKFQARPNGLSKTRTKLREPVDPSTPVNFLDLSANLDAFHATPYKQLFRTPPATCP